MTIRYLFELAPGWAFGADSKQWVLLRGRKRHAQVSWQPVWFITSTKTNFRAYMRRNGIQPTAAGQAMLDALPEKFSDWRALSARGKE